MKYKPRESIASVQKNDLEISMDLHVLRATESKKSNFLACRVCVCVCVCVCLSVCLSVDTITQKIFEV